MAAEIVDFEGHFQKRIEKNQQRQLEDLESSLFLILVSMVKEKTVGTSEDEVLDAATLTSTLAEMYPEFVPELEKVDKVLNDFMSVFFEEETEDELAQYNMTEHGFRTRFLSDPEEPKED